jgi:hypothetical protein
VDELVGALENLIDWLRSLDWLLIIVLAIIFALVIWFSRTVRWKYRYVGAILFGVLVTYFMFWLFGFRVT